MLNGLKTDRNHISWLPNCINFFHRYVLVSALREMNETESITEAPQDCDNSGSIWETGKKLFE